MIDHLAAVTNHFRCLCTNIFDFYKKMSTNIESGEEIIKIYEKTSLITFGTRRVKKCVIAHLVAVTI